MKAPIEKIGKKGYWLLLIDRVYKSACAVNNLCAWYTVNELAEWNIHCSSEWRSEWATSWSTGQVMVCKKCLNGMPIYNLPEQTEPWSSDCYAQPSAANTLTHLSSDCTKTSPPPSTLAAAALQAVAIRLVQASMDLYPHSFSKDTRSSWRTRCLNPFLPQGMHFTCRILSTLPI